MRTQIVPLEIERGVDFQYKAQFVDEDGAPENVSAYTHTAFMKVDFDDPDTVLIFTVDESQAIAGMVFLKLTAVQTTALAEGTYRARFRRTKDGLTSTLWSRQAIVSS